MIRKFVQWMRRVLPRFEFVIVIFVYLIIVESLHLFYLWNTSYFEDDTFQNFRHAQYGGLAFFYGLFRATEFHPIVRNDYRQWLENSPWTWRQPLPAGPILLVLQDLVVVLFLMGGSLETSLRVLYIPMAFLGSYQGVLAVLNWILKEWALAYAVGFGLASLCFFPGRPELQILIVAPCYVFTLLAVKRTLRRLPWDVPNIIEVLNSPSFSAQRSKSLGWHVDTLAPKEPVDLISRHDAICSACLLGWLQFASLYAMDLGPRLEILGLSEFVLAVACLGRVFIYMNGYLSPIDLWGRIRNGRWIIPKYDVIWIASLLALLVGVPLYSLAFKAMNAGHLVGWQIILGPLATTFMLLALFLIGPGLRRWQMTGQHRIVAVHSRSEFTQV